jgi:hypothetical protein
LLSSTKCPIRRREPAKTIAKRSPNNPPGPPEEAPCTRARDSVKFRRMAKAAPFAARPPRDQRARVRNRPDRLSQMNDTIAAAIARVGREGIARLPAAARGLRDEDVAAARER